MFQSIADLALEIYLWADYKSMEIVFTLFGDRIGF